MFQCIYRCRYGRRECALNVAQTGAMRAALEKWRLEFQDYRTANGEWRPNANEWFWKLRVQLIDDNVIRSNRNYDACRVAIRRMAASDSKACACLLYTSDAADE